MKNLTNTNPNQDRYIVRVYDGCDNEWIDICDPTTYEEAMKLYNLKTNNGTINHCFWYLDYYDIYEAEE